MFLLGLLSGLLSAFTQSISYALSARYLQRHFRADWLLYYSQALMGLCCLPTLFYFWPEMSPWKLILWIAPLWVLCYLGGQWCFFYGQRLIESSKLVSLLGLKIPFLAVFSVLFFDLHLGVWPWCAVMLTLVGATLFNWTGGKRLTLKAIIVTLATVILYCGCDLTETYLVKMHIHGDSVRDLLQASFFAICILYIALGAVCWGAIMRMGFKLRLMVDAIPFSACWFGSQIFLFMCFGTVGPIYGNVLCALRGLFSVVFGLILSQLGWLKGEVKVPAAMWVRRGIAAALILAGIALYSFTKAA